MACHAVGVYVGLVKMIRAWISVPIRYPEEATSACQPANVTHAFVHLVHNSFHTESDFGVTVPVI